MLFAFNEEAEQVQVNILPERNLTLLFISAYHPFSRLVTVPFCKGENQIVELNANRKHVGQMLRDKRI